MCGILGIYGCYEVFADLVYGLTALQHRGQEAAGVVTFQNTFHVKKGEGLANQVFRTEDAAYLKGNIGLAHNRYVTHGGAELTDAQPFTANAPFGLAMVHNGNVTNFVDLQRSLEEEHYHLLTSSNDVELILYLLALELKKHNLRDLSVEDIFNSVQRVQQEVKGAYAIITIIANHGMLAFMDPHGIRPLVLGRKVTTEGVSYAFASESKCFDYLGFETIHHLQRGEAIFIDKDKNVHKRNCHQEEPAFCIFEYIYFAKEDSSLHGRLVAQERKKMGHILAKHFQEQNIHPDIVIDVPSSSFFFAQGLAEALGVPYRRALIKNNYAKRSFICPKQKARENIVRHKLNPLKELLVGENVAVVDDSIVRGTTSKHIVSLLRSAGANEVYFTSGSPPIKNPCIYGIDMSVKKEMIASTQSIEEIRKFLGADALIYPALEDIRELYKEQGICDACFSGKYPTKTTAETFSFIEEDQLVFCR